MVFKPRMKNVSKTKFAIVHKSAPVYGGVMKPNPYRSGTVVLRDICRYQKIPDLLLPKISFQRVCREILQSLGKDFRFQASSLKALQEEAEAYIVKLLKQAQLLAVHAKRITVMERDIKFAQYQIEGNFN